MEYRGVKTKEEKGIEQIVILSFVILLALFSERFRWDVVQFVMIDFHIIA